jgi:hypothetical protein
MCFVPTTFESKTLLPANLSRLSGVKHMTTKTTKTVGYVANIEGDADKANLPAVVPAFEKADIVQQLWAANKDERFAILAKLNMGEIAGIGARAGRLADSAYEVLAAKLTAKHGDGWADRKYGGRVLTELEKAERDRLKADLEAIKAAYKAGGYSNPDMAIKYIKDWARGKVGQPRDANVNKARSTIAFLKDELPKMYKRLHKAEDVSESDMVLADAIAVWFKANNMNPREVLGDK